MSPSAGESPEEVMRSIVDDEVITKITEKYINVAFSLTDTKGMNIPDDKVSISEAALKNAILEFRRDMIIMATRREDSDFSAGKMAGSLAFRLARWGVISVNDDTKDYSTIPYLAALGVAVKHFLNIDYSAIDTSIRKELIYTFARRHMNQETLGIVFDVFEKYITRPPAQPSDH